MDACIYDKESILADTERRLVKEGGNFVCRHILCSGETAISVIAVYYTENFESISRFGRDIDICAAELPSVWQLTLG